MAWRDDEYELPIRVGYCGDGQAGNKTSDESKSE